MYACIHGISSGFSAGVCPPSNASAHLRDPPRLSIRKLLYEVRPSPIPPVWVLVGS